MQAFSIYISQPLFKMFCPNFYFGSVCCRIKLVHILVWFTGIKYTKLRFGYMFQRSSIEIGPFWMVVLFVIHSHLLLACVPNIPNQSCLLRIPRNLIPMLARGYTNSKFKLTRVLQITDFTSRNVSFQNNGFVSTVLAGYGYGGHLNLFIRSDDIWTAIMVHVRYETGFSIQFHYRIQ